MKSEMKWKVGDLVEIDVEKLIDGMKSLFFGNQNIARIKEVLTKDRCYGVDGSLRDYYIHEEQIIGPGALFGDEVMVRDATDMTWKNRVLIAINRGYVQPYLCVFDECKKGLPIESNFEVVRWKYMKPISEEQVIKMTTNLTVEFNGKEMTRDEAIKLLGSGQ